MGLACYWDCLTLLAASSNKCFFASTNLQVGLVAGRQIPFWWIKVPNPEAQASGRWPSLHTDRVLWGIILDCQIWEVWRWSRWRLPGVAGRTARGLQKIFCPRDWGQREEEADSAYFWKGCIHTSWGILQRNYTDDRHHIDNKIHAYPMLIADGKKKMNGEGVEKVATLKAPVTLSTPWQGKEDLAAAKGRLEDVGSRWLKPSLWC